MKRLILALFLPIITLIPFTGFAQSQPSTPLPFTGLLVGGYVGASDSNYNNTISMYNGFSEPTTTEKVGGDTGTWAPLVGIKVGMLFPIATSHFRAGIEVFTDYTFNNMKKHLTTSEAILNTKVKLSNGINAGADVLFGFNFMQKNLAYVKAGPTISRLRFSNTNTTTNAYSATSYEPGYLYALGLQRMVTKHLSLDISFQHMQTDIMKQQFSPTTSNLRNTEKLSLAKSDVILSLNYYFD